MLWVVFPNPATHILKLETPAPQNVNVFGNRVFKVIIKVEWNHMNGPWSNMIAVLLRGDYDTNICKQEERSSKDTARRWSCASYRERDLRRNQPYWLHLRLPPSKNWEGKKLFCLSHPVHGTLLWQPEQTLHEGCPVCCSMFRCFWTSSVSLPTDTSGNPLTPKLWHPKMSPHIAKCLLGAKSSSLP